MPDPKIDVAELRGRIARHDYPEWSDIAPLLDQLEQARREVERLKADVRVAYGFDKAAVFANIDNLTSLAERLRGALEHYAAGLNDRGQLARKNLITDADREWAAECAAALPVRQAFRGE
jgi:hypothetical protein